MNHEFLSNRQPKQQLPAALSIVRASWGEMTKEIRQEQRAFPISELTKSMWTLLVELTRELGRAGAPSLTRQQANLVRALASYLSKRCNVTPREVKQQPHEVLARADKLLAHTVAGE
mmetsp:Transcript_28746/g.90113  ORF Transcript_28746/g.90113 Transcript_28746/m.90113 type:complete len:117 (+) Transcript_28746:23-373(+)